MDGMVSLIYKTSSVKNIEDDIYVNLKVTAPKDMWPLVSLVLCRLLTKYETREFHEIHLEDLYFFFNDEDYGNLISKEHEVEWIANNYVFTFIQHNLDCFMRELELIEKVSTIIEVGDFN